MIEWVLETIKIETIDFVDQSMNWRNQMSLTSACVDSSFPSPLVLFQKSNGTFQIIDGFRRFEHFYREKQKHFCQALLLPKTASLEQRLFFRLSTFPESTAYDVFKICKVIRQLHEQDVGVLKIAEQVLPHLGQKASKKRVEKILRLERILLQYKDSIEYQKYTINDLLPLTSFPNVLSADFFTLLDSFRVGGNKLKVLLELFNEVCRIHNKSISQLILDQEIQNIKNNESLNENLKYRLLKEYLYEMRFPELSKLRKKLNKVKQELNLSSHSIVLENDPFFEQDFIKMILKSSSTDQLGDQLRVLLEIHQSKKIDELWSIIHSTS